jgi:diguanylate cyclase (GGDEF)-like protein
MLLLPSHRGTLVESELGQAFVRFLGGLTVLAVYLLAAGTSSTRGWAGVLACVLTYVAYAYGWLWLVAKQVGEALSRQRAALVLDHLIYATCFSLGGRPVAILAWVAVTTSVGHGLRFGERRGIAAACIGSASILAAVELGPGWQLPLPIAGGMAATALVVPLYVVRLVRTIEQQRREAELRALKLAEAVRIDALTGVLSRAGFYETIRSHQELAKTSGEHVGLVYLDLDGFKTINDTRGHDVGDIVLREVAQLLASAVRGSDSVARMGGDEFAIVVKSPASEEAVLRVAEKAAEAICNCQHEAAVSSNLGASAGVALLAPGASVADAIRTADMRMFEAKRRTKSLARGRQTGAT